MIKSISLSLLPAEAADERSVRKHIATELGLNRKRISGYRTEKRSIDARGRLPRIILQLTVFLDTPPEGQPPFDPELKDVSQAQQVVIVGAGPAGLFAALRLISLGLRPLLLERGKDVRSRRRDLAAMNKEGVVNPESNYCFGEGGGS